MRADETSALLDRVLAAGEKAADEVEVYCAAGNSVSLDLKRRLIGEAHGGESWGMGIRVISDGHIGVSSTSDPSLWDECLSAAVASAKLATPQEWHGLPGKKHLAGDVDVCDPTFEIIPGTILPLAKELLEGASLHPQADVAGGSVSVSKGHRMIANTEGAFYELSRTGVSVSLETIAGTSTGYEFDHSCYLGEIDARKTGQEAAFLASHSRKAEEVETGEYDIVLSPVAAAQLIGGILFPALSGRNVKAGRSFLSEKQGEEIFDQSFSLTDDPFSGPESTPFDAEATPTRQIPFIRGGVVEEFAWTLKTAYRYGEKSSGSAVRGGPGGAPATGYHNLHVSGPGGDPCRKEAVWVHDLIGAHTANTVTGDFSVELSNATWVKDGERGRAIRSGMLSGNFFEMLQDIAASGEKTREVGSIILPAIRFNNQRVVGK